jgi:hypothetical protein
MITAEITKSMGAMYFDGAFPKTEYGTGEQKKNAEGVPLWSVSVLLRQPDSRKTESLTVTMPAAQDPAALIEPFTPIAFEGLRVMTGENGGRVWVSFAADKCGKPKQQ